MSKYDLINKSYLVTLNQRVQGSSPCAPTIDVATIFSIFHQNKIEQHRPFGRSFGRFCSPFELLDGTLSQRGIAV